MIDSIHVLAAPMFLRPDEIYPVPQIRSKWQRTLRKLHINLYSCYFDSAVFNSNTNSGDAHVVEQFVDTRTGGGGNGTGNGKKYTAYGKELPPNHDEPIHRHESDSFEELWERSSPGKKNMPS